MRVIQRSSACLGLPHPAPSPPGVSTPAGVYVSHRVVALFHATAAHRVPAFRAFPVLTALGGFPSSALLTLQALRDGPSTWDRRPRPRPRAVVGPPTQPRAPQRGRPGGVQSPRVRHGGDEKRHPATGGHPCVCRDVLGPKAVEHPPTRGRGRQLRQGASPVCGRKLAPPRDPSTTTDLAYSEPEGSPASGARVRAPSSTGAAGFATNGSPGATRLLVTRPTRWCRARPHRRPDLPSAPPPRRGLTTVASHVGCGVEGLVRGPAHPRPTTRQAPAVAGAVEVHPARTPEGATPSPPPTPRSRRRQHADRKSVV